MLADRAVAGGSATQTTHSLDSGSALGYRADVHRTGERWRFGVDFTIFRTDQDTEPRTGAAGGNVAQRIFVVGGGQVVSNGPSQQLYYQRLEDTTVELWSADFVASRRIAGGDRNELRLGFGLRAADFDNDYRAVAGIEDVGGLRLDASSNHDRMHGPLVSLSGSLEPRYPRREHPRALRRFGRRDRQVLRALRLTPTEALASSEGARRGDVSRGINASGSC